MTDMREQAYRAVQERCGIIDWPAWGVIHVGGVDRAGFLHNLLSNDITALQPGGGCEAALLTASKATADFFEAATTLKNLEGDALRQRAKAASNWMLGVAASLLNASISTRRHG